MSARQLVVDKLLDVVVSVDLEQPNEDFASIGPARRYQQHTSLERHLLL